MAEINIKQIAKQFGKTHALHSIDLTISDPVSYTHLTLPTNREV